MEQKWAFHVPTTGGNEQKWPFQAPTTGGKGDDINLKQPITMEKCEKKEDSSDFFVRYSQETSFSGLKYIGENGSFLRRWVMYHTFPIACIKGIGHPKL